MKNTNPYFFYSIVVAVVGLFIWIITPQPLRDLEPMPYIPKIEQRVNILTEDKKSTLEYRWLMENEEDLKDGKLKMSDCPYSAEKTIYKLKTSMDSISSFVYGTQVEIERQKCIEYNKFIDMRTNLLSLNKPTTCK